MYEGIAIIGAAVAAVGGLVAVFAKPLGRINERLVLAMPEPMKRFYRTAAGGTAYDASPWIAYNRIGGLLVTLFGSLLCALALLGGSV